MVRMMFVESAILLMSQKTLLIEPVVFTIDNTVSCIFILSIFAMISIAFVNEMTVFIVSSFFVFAFFELLIVVTSFERFTS